ncbi:hypothetical protein [Thermomonospora cellulosilytica]|uniref:Uncharacterized protein n=1 Tax=Thermomonospora cellulosilytica TaxID=1411118 RepID=A0A7W3N1S6_9ACTN|nr:hypothetical protein [Thermomonospora cellulosilytica]MBA9005976.1 hypothetical protein [Thermomonospora cellulosilytica]
MTEVSKVASATYLRTATVPLGELTPYPGNAKRGDAATSLESLCSNGQYRSLVVREVEPDQPDQPDQPGRLVVLAGNHTLQAIAAHGPGPCGMTYTVGEEERPCGLCGGKPWEPAARCEIVTCNDATARRINLVDNRSADLGTYDDTALLELIAGLDGDLIGTGYTDTDLGDLLEVLEIVQIEETPYDEDEADEGEEGGGQENGREPQQGQADDVPAAQGPAGAADGPAAAPPAGQPAAPAQGVQPTTQPAQPAQPVLPQPPGQVHLILTYPPEDRDEANRLIAAAREVLPAAGTPEIVLRGLRTLVAVLDSRHAPDGTVTVASLLRAADVELH